MPWKMLAGLVPVIVQLLKGGDGADIDRKMIAEMETKISDLENGHEELLKSLKLMFFGLVVLFVVSLASLVIAIIAVTK